MQLGKSILIVVFLYFSSLITAHSNETTPLDNWLEFCPNSQLCFEHPLSLIPADVQVIDSITGQLDNKNISLVYDLGRYASKFPEFSSASYELVNIDDYEGKILIQQNKMALTVPNISGGTAFSMLIEFKNTVDLEQGRRIFKSVKFNLIK
ncbi:hypothetical protein EKO29_13195 [Colwellia sp. Arc7-635]|jgi:hypothetical protein|uniref:hypothetical protein n=1 Tax=Colwellia sp. Arc7-635 TaxID=2497879 RepID=UPI000F8522AE|nr:hypothetical protein [Colwellia sp. Arc7-635]AZQ84863.1 hypothetical protein EKO29_13195 [Colwellia sp. Arc7-635]